MTESRKARQWRARNELILDEADALYAEGGYLGLNLDHLAQRVEYSKATIYNHFISKEDLLLGMAVEHLRLRKFLFSQALLFPGRSRERMCSIGVADELIHERKPHGFALVQLVKTASIWEKTSEANQMKLDQFAAATVEIPREIVRQARESGDLPEDGPPDSQILTGLISMAKGSFLLDEVKLFSEEAIRPVEYRFANYSLFLDGAGWQPFTADYDWQASRQRARQHMEQAYEEGMPVAGALDVEESVAVLQSAD